MKKEDISPLLQRYLSACDSGKEPYFDADELIELLDSFVDSVENEHFEDILALGLKLHPGNIDLQVRQCRFYIFNEEYDSALALVETIGETENQDLDLVRLECYCMLERYDTIKEYTNKLIEKKCDYLESIFEYIVPLLNDMDMDKEARDYNKIGLELFPKNPTLREELGYSLEIKGDIAGSIKIYNELIDENPYSFDYWFTLGRLYSFNKEFDKAIEAFDFALTCNDSSPDLKILKAYCYYMNENYEKALELYAEIVNAPQSSPQQKMILNLRVSSLMAECYMKLEDYEGAYGLLKHLVDNNMVFETMTYIDFIRCCSETDRGKEASDTLLNAVKRYPDDIRLLSLLAMTYVENGEDELAIETTERLFDALDRGKHNIPEDYENLINAGQFLYLKGNTDQALKYYKKVLEVRPRTPYIHIHMAMAYLAKGDMKRFGEHFGKTTPKELMKYLKDAGATVDDVEQQLYSKYIPSKDLAKEFLKNKDNNN